MKLYLIAVLFIATLVVVPCLAEEEKQETTEQVADVPEIAENKNDEAPSEATTEGDTKDEEPSVETEGDAKEEEKAEDADEQIPEEFQDEIQQEKRRRLPQLSHRSCGILKRYGYCKTKIAKFCIKICRPRCRDRLSALSCRRVRYTYKKCNHHIGKYYCRKTCRHGCGQPALPIQCRRHRFLNEANRNVRYKGAVLCDNKLNGWYRYTGRAGSRMPNKCAQARKNYCGTHAAGWMVGQYPRSRGQNVRRKVCFNWSRGCCTWSNFIQVTNCGGYFVFKLKKPPGCSYRYCGI